MTTLRQHSYKQLVRKRAEMLKAHMFQVYAEQRGRRTDWAEGAVRGGAVHVEQQAQCAFRARVQRNDGVVDDAQLHVRRQDLEVVLKLHGAPVVCTNDEQFTRVRIMFRVRARGMGRVNTSCRASQLRVS